jgi:hypothetical protein
VKKELNTEGVVSSSLQINTGSFTGSFTGTLITPILSASIFTGSHVQLTNVVDTVATNKVLVLNTATNKIFTTASIGSAGATFPYTGSAIISGSIANTGSLNILSGSITVTNGNFSLINGATSYATTFVGGTGYITDAIGSNIYFKVNTGNGLIFTGDNGVFGPNLINNISLGQPSGRWSNTYTNNLFTSGSITHTGSLDILSGSINVTRGGITGSVTGSFTGALTHFSPSTLKLTVGTTAPASPAVNDLWVDTN